MAYYITGSVTLGIWAKKAGAWAKVAERRIEIYQEVGGAGNQAVNFDVNYDVDMGTAVQAFGVTVEAYEGVGATLTDFVSAVWTGTAASGERSATPNGQFSTVTVRPQ
jgi:hypothetical protein